MNTVRIKLVVIRSTNIEVAYEFYRQIGMHLVKHSHGRGPDHYTAELDGVVFEIYPKRTEMDTTTNIRLGFEVASLDATLERLKAQGVAIQSDMKKRSKSKQIVVRDPDGHTVELMETIRESNAEESATQ